MQKNKRFPQSWLSRAINFLVRPGRQRSYLTPESAIAWIHSPAGRAWVSSSLFNLPGCGGMQTDQTAGEVGKHFSSHGVQCRFCGRTFVKVGPGNSTVAGDVPLSKDLALEITLDKGFLVVRTVRLADCASRLRPEDACSFRTIHLWGRCIEALPALGQGLRVGMQQDLRSTLLLAIS